MSSTLTQPISGTFVADPHSSFQFAVKHMKVATFRAGFEDVRARLVAGEDGISLEGRARADSVSVRTPPELREHLVNGADFFDAANHPEIAFSSRGVELADDGTARVEGDLTIRGVTRPVVAAGTYQPPVEDPYGGTRIALALTATLDRRDWGLDWQAALPGGGDVLAWDVTLSVDLELIREA